MPGTAAPSVPAVSLLDGGGSLSNGASVLTFLARNDPNGMPPDDTTYTITVDTLLTGTGGLTFESQFGFRNAAAQTLALTNSSNTISGTITVVSNKDNGNGQTRLLATSDGALGTSGNTIVLTNSGEGKAELHLNYIGSLTHEVQQNQNVSGFNASGGIFLSDGAAIEIAQDGLLTGSGGRQIYGDGSIELTFASSTDTGDYEIERETTLILNNGDQIGSGTVTLLDNGGLRAKSTFTLTNEVETDRSSGGPNFITVDSGQTLTLTDFGNSGDKRDNRQFAKQGAGTLNLDDTNGWDNDGGGFVFVEGGTLLANNTSGSATGQAEVVVQSGGTLGGAGIAAPGVGDADRQLLVESGGTISPGELGSSDTGTLTIDLSRTPEGAEFLSGAEFTFDLNGVSDHDVLAFIDDTSLADAFTSDVLFNGNLINFNDLTGGSLANGSYTLMTFDADTNYEGTLAIGTGLSSYSGSTLVFNDDSSVVLNLVPEPSTALLAMLGLLPLLRRRMRS